MTVLELVATYNAIHGWGDGGMVLIGTPLCGGGKDGQTAPVWSPTVHIKHGITILELVAMVGWVGGGAVWSPTLCVLSGGGGRGAEPLYEAPL